MDINFEEQIRERAYQIWLAGGMSDGLAHEHWASAEQEVLVEIIAAPVTAETDAAMPAKPKRVRKAASEPKAPRAKATKAATTTKAATASKTTKAKH